MVTSYGCVGGNCTLADPGSQPVKWLLMVYRIAVDELPIVGGNLALDFANTQSGPPGGEPDVESLAGYEDLVAWALRRGVVGRPDAEGLVRNARRHPRDSDAAFEQATALRDRIHTIFTSIAADAEPPADALGRLRDNEAEALAHANLAAGAGRLRVDLVAPSGSRRAPLADRPRRRDAADRGPARAGQGLRRLPLPVPGRDEERQPALVQHGRVRDPSEDAPLRRPQIGCQVRGDLAPAHTD